MSLKALTFPIKVLAGPLSTTGDRLILPDIKHWDGNDLTSAEVGTVMYATLQDFGKTKMEIVELDPSTLTVATTTGVLINKRALSFNGGTTALAETSELWTPNETYVLLGSNPPQLYADLMDLNENQTVASGVKTFVVSPIVPTPTTDYQAATKKYADDLTYAGAPDSDEATKGVVECATQAESDAGDDAGTTTAPTALRPSKAANSVQRGAWVGFAETASGDDAYTATTTPSFTPALHSMVVGSFAVGNTTGATFALNGETPVAIQKIVSGALGALETGDIIANTPLFLYRTASVWVLMSPGGTMPTTALLSEMATFFGATDMTGAEAETLTSGQTNDATNYHHHANLIASTLNTTLAASVDEQTVLTATLPAGILSTKHGVRVRLSMSHVSHQNGDNILINFKLGGTTVTLTVNSVDGTSERVFPNLEFVIINTSASAQKYSLTGVRYLATTLAAIVMASGTAAVDTSGAVTVAVTTDTTDANNAVVVRSCTLEYLYAV